MDIHFQDYYNHMFVISRDDNNPEEYIKYFEAIGGLNLYSIPSTGLNLKMVTI